MFTWKANVLALLLTAFTLNANAEGKRYLVQFKSSEAFKAVAQNVAATKANPFASQGKMTLFNQNAVVADSLEHLDMLVVESTDEAAMNSLAKHPAIGLVEEEIMHPAPKQIATNGAQTFATNPATVDMPWGIKAVKAPEAWNVTRGLGVRVMVLDTGADSAHGSIASRLEKGRNFTGGDMDDFSDVVGHGSHVAGTILADGANGGLVGVAPDARLLMGKVCATNGCSSIAIASGINWAIDEKVQVINMSLGGFFISAGERTALDRAEAEGVMVVAASGNSGTSSVSYPAAYRSVLAVGAVDSNLVKADFSQYGPELAVVAPGVDVISSVPRGTGRGSSVMVDFDGKGLTPVASTYMVGAPVAAPGELELVYVGLGKAEDFQNVSVAGKYALISRGEITFKEKVDNAILAGARGVIIFNNEPGLLQGGLTDNGTEVAIPAVMIEQTVGETLRDRLAQGISTRGSLSVDATDFAPFAGTSMASPHVAGVAALVLAANPKLTPAQVRDVIKDTATPLGPNDRNQYGRGLVNAEAAVQRALSLN